MNNFNTINIGDFDMTTPIARISDPCYDKDTWCAGSIDNCKIGKWKSKVVSSDEGDWGDRIAYLIAWHESATEPSHNSIEWQHKEIDVGVDSGQAGIFDEANFKNADSVKGVERIGGDNEPICEDDPWYSICCDRTLSDDGAGVIPFGCVSSSGYGDGRYNASTIDDGHNVVAIMIDYGLYEEDDDGYADDTDTCLGCMRSCYVEDMDFNGYCETCHNEMFDTCSVCGNEFETSELQGGICDSCSDEQEDSDADEGVDDDEED